MIHVPATVHGRVLIEPDGGPAVSSSVLVGFHGYAQTAEDMMAELRQIPGAEGWTRISIQALNRFYIRGDQRVVSSWMTREDRELAIADNIAYVNAALDTALGPSHGAPSTEHPALVYIGFSQGVAMAYRAALSGARPAAGLIALAGDIPPELQGDVASLHPWPKVLIGVGDREEWYSADKVARDVGFLASQRIDHSLVRFDGGHEWTDAFRAAAGQFLSSLP
ncbi:MAG: phospholipase [Acidobacteria bacterium]|nr:phospholipase [Acidobacteriota bacterium]